MSVLEVAEPAAQRPIEIGDDAGEAVAARASRLRSDAVLEAGQALLADQTPAGFEPIAEEVEAFPELPAVADMSLVRMRMQVDVRQQRTDHRTLRRPLRRRPSFHAPQDVLREPAAQQTENAPIADALLDPLHQPLVWDGVEVALKVGVHHEGMALFDQMRHFAQRVPATAPRPKAVARRTERRLEDRFQHELYRRLDNAILDRGYPQRSRLAVALRDVDPLDRLR